MLCKHRYHHAVKICVLVVRSFIEYSLYGEYILPFLQSLKNELYWLVAFNRSVFELVEVVCLLCHILVLMEITIGIEPINTEFAVQTIYQSSMLSCPPKGICLLLFEYGYSTIHSLKCLSESHCCILKVSVSKDCICNHLAFVFSLYVWISPLNRIGGKLYGRSYRFDFGA